jgi:hypothetical protein
MASLIIHGNLDDDDEPLGSPLYVRPMLKPDGSGRESIPDDELPVDMTWRAVRRMFEGDAGEPASAPTVRVINISIGDPEQCFHHLMSPWARMVDWLAWEYKVLFLISSGNHFDNVEVAHTGRSFAALSVLERQSAILKKLDETVRMRRILSPSESMNCLTVGATHEDASRPNLTPMRHDPLPSGAPCTYSAVGLGYGNSVKPDILAPGGRMFYGEGNSNPSIPLLELRPEYATRFAPGIRVADPGNQGGLDAEGYSRGTSNATALSTHMVAKAHDILAELSSQSDRPELLDDEHAAVLLKALLVHSASWDDGTDFMRSVLLPDANDQDFRKYIARFTGHGRVRPERLLECTEERATLIGVGELIPGKDGSAHEFEVPLPSSLSGVLQKRRFTVTLAWLTPLNFRNRKYRRASLYYTFSEGLDSVLQASRKHVDHHAVKRGTVQHEVFESADDTTVVIADGQLLTIKVNARPYATNRLDDPVPYALAVSLEVAEGVGLPIYSEVRAGIAIRAAIRAGAEG